MQEAGAEGRDPTHRARAARQGGVPAHVVAKLFDRVLQDLTVSTALYLALLILVVITISILAVLTVAYLSTYTTSISTVVM